MDTKAPTPPAKIYGQLAKVMAEVGHIGKDRKASMGSSGSYNFRGIDDVYAAVQLVMAKHGVICVPKVLHERSEERTTRSGTVLIYRVLKIRYTFYAEDGSSVSAVVIGEGMDSGDKASNKAMSVAQKYALLQVLLVPTVEAKDPEDDHHEVVAKDSPTKPNPAKPKTFDPKIKEHGDILVRQLEERNVPDDYWDAIAAHLTGKPSPLKKSDIEAAIKAGVK